MKYPRKEEALKYNVLYREGYHNGPVKRTMNWGLPRMQLGRDSIIDLGCGQSTSRDWFPLRSHYHGVDISDFQIKKCKDKSTDSRDSYACINLADMHVYTDKQFTLGISVDVLEHIPPEFVLAAIEHMCRICDNLIISISLIPEKSNKSHDGSPLHLCLKPREWWIDLFKKYTNVEDTGSAGVGNLVMVCGPGAISQVKDTVFLTDAKRGRILLDGTFMLPRKNEELEADFDSRHVRIEGERRWEPRILYKYGIDALPKTDNLVFIVGKGPTLDNLTESSFIDSSTAPIICVNEALIKVESLNLPNPIYLIQHDNLDIIPKKDGTIPILEKDAKNLYPHIQIRYIYSRHALGLPIALTCLAAIHVAKIMDAKQINMVCFDAATHEDCGYAAIVGYDVKTKSDGDGPAGSRFLSHRKHIVDVCGETKLMWLTPDLGGAVAYTPQLLLGNHAGHREHDLEGSVSVSPAMLDLPS